MPKTELEKRTLITVKMNPKILKATDAVAEMFKTSRTDIIELGLSVVFKNAIELICEDIGKDGGL